MKILFIVFALLFTSSFSTVYEYGELSGNYMLFVPSQNTGKLIVALHGSGERDGLYIENWKKAAQKNSFLVLAPNAGIRDGWSGMDIAHVLSLVQKTQKDYNIKYTLLNGASAGGHFALFLGINYYPYFTAIQTFMGLVITSLGENIHYQTDKDKQLPILLIHGVKDSKIPIKYGRINYELIKDKGYPVTYWEEANMEHEFYVADNEKILKWFNKVIGK